MKHPNHANSLLTAKLTHNVALTNPHTQKHTWLRLYGLDSAAAGGNKHIRPSEFCVFCNGILHVGWENMKEKILYKLLMQYESLRWIMTL